MVTKKQEQAPRVQVSAYHIVQGILDAPFEPGTYDIRGIQVIHVLKNGRIKITFNDGGIMFIENFKVDVE
jgi:hypothetical protein